MIYGIAEELLKLSIRYGPGEIPAGWGEGGTRGRTERAQRYLTIFSPAAFVLALDEVLEQAGVEMMLDTLVCKAVLEDGRVTGLEVENKSGRGLLRAQVVVDATGRRRCGCPRRARLRGGRELAFAVGGAAFTRGQPAGAGALCSRWCRWAATRGEKGSPRGWRKSGVLDHTAVTRFVLDGRRLLRGALPRAPGRGSGPPAIFSPLTLPSQAQFRTTRRIIGRATLVDGPIWRAL